jgi:hypothetical protein
LFFSERSALPFCARGRCRFLQGLPLTPASDLFKLFVPM